MLNKNVQKLRHIAHRLIDTAIGVEPDPGGERRKKVYEWLAGQCGDAAGFTNGRNGAIHLRYIFTEDESKHIIGLLLLLFKDQAACPVEEYIEADPPPEFTRTESVASIIEDKKLLQNLAIASRINITARDTAPKAIYPKKKKKSAGLLIQTRSDRLIDLLESITFLEPEHSYNPQQQMIIDMMTEIALEKEIAIDKNIAAFISKYFVENTVHNGKKIFKRNALFEDLYGAFMLFENETVLASPTLPSSASSGSSHDTSTGSESDSHNSPSTSRRRVSSSSGSDTSSSSIRKENSLRRHTRQADKAHKANIKAFNMKVREAKADAMQKEEEDQAKAELLQKQELALAEEKSKASSVPSLSKDLGKTRALTRPSPAPSAAPFNMEAFVERLNQRKEQEIKEKAKYRNSQNLRRAQTAYDARSLDKFNELSPAQKKIFAQLLTENESEIYGEYRGDLPALTLGLDNGTIMLGRKAQKDLLGGTNIMYSPQYKWKINNKGAAETLTLGFSLIPFTKLEAVIEIFKEHNINCIGFNNRKYGSTEKITIRDKRNSKNTLIDPPIGEQKNRIAISLFSACGNTQILEAISETLYAPLPHDVPGIILVFTDADKIYSNDVKELELGNTSIQVCKSAIYNRLGYRGNRPDSTAIKAAAKSSLPSYEEIKPQLETLFTASSHLVQHGATLTFSTANQDVRALCPLTQ